MKKKIILISTIFIIVISIIATIVFINSKKLEVKITASPKVLINTKKHNIDYIEKIKNGTIITKKEKIDTSKIGNQKIKIIIKNYFGKEIDYSYELKVYDDIAPVITYKEQLTTEEGSEIDLLKDVSVNDNSNEEINVEVKGEYDYKKAGTYNLKYVATDSSKNTTEKDFVLTVKKKEVVKTVQSTTKPIPADTTFTTSKGFQGKTVDGLTYIDGILIVNKTYSLPSTYGTGLTTTTQNAFNEMRAAATLEGFNIYLSSGFRSYNTQNKLYNNYVKRDGQAAADTYSARAGHSEHQSGLAFDVNQVNDTFNNTAEAKWLSDNCYKYGFILRYPKGKTNETGYKYESWHFRYVGTELATKLYNNGDWITLESYFGITSEY